MVVRDERRTILQSLVIYSLLCTPGGDVSSSWESFNLKPDVYVIMSPTSFPFIGAANDLANSLALLLTQAAGGL